MERFDGYGFVVAGCWNDTGEPVRMYGIVMDVTERKRTDESKSGS